MSQKTIILAISGRKQSGKNSVCDFLQEYLESKHGIIISTFAFADKLKRFCIDVLGLTEEQCYGTDEQKNTPTNYHWNDMPEYIRNGMGNKPEDRFMTAREVMQVFGQLIRDVYGNVWAKSTIQSVVKSMNKLQGLMWKPMAVVTDTRYPNEIEAVMQHPFGFVLRLTRAPFKDQDTHSSECSLDNFDWQNTSRCFVLDNVSMNIAQQNEKVAGIANEIVAYCS